MGKVERELGRQQKKAKEEQALSNRPFYRDPYIVAYIILQMIFSFFEFGTVFLVISILFFIIKNTGTSKKENEISAYSVFNKGTQRIQGSLTAEQFENEILRKY